MLTTAAKASQTAGHQVHTPFPFPCPFLLSQYTLLIYHHFQRYTPPGDAHVLTLLFSPNILSVPIHTLSIHVYPYHAPSQYTTSASRGHPYSTHSLNTFFQHTHTHTSNIPSCPFSIQHEIHLHPVFQVYQHWSDMKLSNKIIYPLNPPI